MNAQNLIKNTYTFIASGPKEELREKYCKLRDIVLSGENPETHDRLLAEMAEMIEPKWIDGFSNLVPTAGKNDILDKYWAGSGYTAAWYMGLIGLASYTALDVADISSSHTGWVEDVNYSQANRPAITFAAAAGGIKSSTANVQFSMNATTTIKGAFVISNNTKGGTTGILVSEGLLAEGDRACKNGDTLEVGFSSILA